jgi:zinc protease
MNRAMKRLFLPLLVLALFTQAALAMESVELPMPNSGKVVIRLMFRNGSVTDPKGKEGLTMLTAGLITDGSTKNHTATELQKTMYPWAARMGSFVDKEISIFSFEVPSLYLEPFYALVKDVLMNPAFDSSDVERIRSNQKNFVDEVIRQSSDEEYGKKYLEYVLFRGTPYGNLKQGTSSGISSITVNDIREHYRNRFTRNNVLVGVAGDYPKGFPERVKNDLGGLSDVNPTAPAISAPGIRPGMNLTIISKQGALGSAISAGFPMAITRSNDEFVALMVANSWLGEHRKSYSRLYQKIREARSMNYGDYTYVEWYEGGGGNMLPPAGTPRSLNYFSIWLRPVQTAKGLRGQYEELKDLRVGHAPFAMRMALREMNSLVENGMSADDFGKTRDFLRSYSKLYVEGMSKKLGYAMDAKFYGRTDWIADLDRLLLSLTREQVNAAMKKYWSSGNIEWVVVTDESEVAPLQETFEKGLPAPMAYSNGLKASLTPEILTEDETVNNYPLPIRSVTIIPSDKTFQGE